MEELASLSDISEKEAETVRSSFGSPLPLSPPPPTPPPPSPPHPLSSLHSHSGHKLLFPFPFSNTALNSHMCLIFMCGPLISVSVSLRDSCLIKTNEPWI